MHTSARVCVVSHAVVFNGESVTQLQPAAKRRQYHESFEGCGLSSELRGELAGAQVGVTGISLVYECSEVAQVLQVQMPVQGRPCLCLSSVPSVQTRMQTGTHLQAEMHALVILPMSLSLSVSACVLVSTTIRL